MMTEELVVEGDNSEEKSITDALQRFRELETDDLEDTIDRYRKATAAVHHQTTDMDG